jgi:chlorobactene glucosyltransferase
MLEFIWMFQVVSLLPVVIITIYNFLTAPKVKRSNEQVKPKVSVLIPARNEANNIATIMKQVLSASDLADLELLVLDDHSTDETAEVIKQVLATHPRGHLGKLISGKDLLPGWLGKPWACQQLARAASGEYLVFIDADVKATDWYIASAINLMRQHKASMLSTQPTQIMHTWGEKLTVSYINWLLLSFLPMNLIYLLPISSLAAANGQFILFRKDAYWSIDGHAAVANKIVDDVNLAKLIKSKRYKLVFTLGGNGISCRMYSSFDEALNGLTKNLNKVVPWPIYILVNSLIIFTFLGSFFGMLWSPFFMIPVLIILAQRLIVARTSMQPVLANLVLTVPQFLLIIYIELRAFTNNWGRGIKWKNRAI